MLEKTWKAIVKRPTRRDPQGSAMVATGSGTMAADFTNSGNTHEESMANAKIAAAAPEMLDFIAYVYENSGERTIREKARVILAKVL